MFNTWNSSTIIKKRTLFFISLISVLCSSRKLLVQLYSWILISELKFITLAVKLIGMTIIQILFSKVFLFGSSKEERPEEPVADPDYVPPETEYETSWFDGSELSGVVDDLSLVTDFPPRSDNDDLELRLCMVAKTCQAVSFFVNL